MITPENNAGEIEHEGAYPVRTYNTFAEEVMDTIHCLEQEILHGPSASQRGALFMAENLKLKCHKDYGVPLPFSKKSMGR